MVKKTGNISMRAAKQLFGSKDVGSIVVRAAEKNEINKTASSGDIESAQTQFFSPRLTQDTWFLPRSRKMLLKWVKIYADADPSISSVLRMHARYPISEFDIVTNNDKQKELFESVFHQDTFEILDILREIATSYYRYGESVWMSEWSKKYGVWTGSTCLDPSLIEVEEVPFTNRIKIYAEIPNKVKKLFKSKKEEDKTDKDNMPEEIKEILKQGGEYIELDTEESGSGRDYDPARCGMITNKTDVGEDGLRGLPPIYCLLRNLVVQDFLNKAQFERAKRFAYPIEFWKLGDTAKDIFPSDQDLKNVRELLRVALASPPYSIIYSPLLSCEIIGSSGQMLDIKPDMDRLDDQKLIGLGTNKNIVLGEGSWMGASKTISLQRLIMDYQVDRDMYTRKVLKGHYMRALCNRWGYVKKSPITGLTTPDIPGINWHKDLDPQNSEDTKKQYKEMWKDSMISTRTYFSKFPELDYSQEMKALEEEIGSVYDNGVRKLRLPSDKLPNGSVGATPLKPDAPIKPEKPTKEDAGDEGKGKEEKVIKVVEAPLSPPPPRPEKKEK
jgi:hypothetical protein